MNKYKVQKSTKLLAFLRDELQESYSVKALKRAIDNKCCKVNGRVERISTRMLQPGDTVEIDLAPSAEMKLQLLYEDEWLVAVDKPAGLISENDSFRKLGKLELIHRLDKETSGVILLAKTAETKAKMVELFREKSFLKNYYALVDGYVEAKEGKIESFLVKKASRHGQVFWGSVESGRLPAITYWKCEKRTAQASLLICQPVTGRTHQLRVHFSEMGHPILGDLQYGKSFTCKLALRRHMLHAYLVRFPHPMTEKVVEIKAPLPQDFLEAKKQLKL